LISGGEGQETKVVEVVITEGGQAQGTVPARGVE